MITLMLGLCSAVSTDNRAVNAWWMIYNMKKVNYGSLCVVFCSHFQLSLLLLTPCSWQVCNYEAMQSQAFTPIPLQSCIVFSLSTKWVIMCGGCGGGGHSLRRLQRQVLQLPLIAQINQPPREGLTTPLCGLKWSKQSSKRLLTTQGLLQKL